MQAFRGHASSAIFCGVAVENPSDAQLSRHLAEDTRDVHPCFCLPLPGHLLEFHFPVSMYIG
eukprot:362009-Chlamydomonas_euryale.AAC.7